MNSFIMFFAFIMVIAYNILWAFLYPKEYFRAITFKRNSDWKWIYGYLLLGIICLILGVLLWKS